MTGFIIGAIILALAAIALVVWPLWRRADNTESAHLSHKQMNTAIYRDQMAEMERDRASGMLSQEDYDQALAELQRRMLEDTTDGAGGDSAAMVTAPNRALPVALGGFVVLGAILAYMALGNPLAINPPPPQEQGHMGGDEIARMVAGMAAKLEKEPDNHRGWAMLARSYKVMERFPEAVAAYARTGPMLDTSAELLVDYADALAVVEQGFSPKVLELVDKALKLEPTNMQGLWLRGTAAFEAEQYGKAIADWELLLKQLTHGSEEYTMIKNNIEQTRALMAQSGKR